jgi:DNA-binding CsgD family transcriptional regulator
MFGEYGPIAGPNFPNAPVGNEILAPVLEFLESSTGRLPLEGGMKAVSEFVRAEAVAISRSTFNAAAPRLVAVFDTDVVACAPLERTFVSELLGPYLDRLKTGAIWSLSRHMAGASDDLDPVVTGWLRRRGLKDIFILVLESRTGHSDYLEIHLRRDPNPSLELRIEAIGPLLVRFWANRKPGLVADCLGRHTRKRVSGGNAMTSDVPLLSDQNPAGLTRSEFRVCMMVRRGLSIKSISEELSLSVTTIRTHLRNIYVKTGVSGFNELAHRLISTDERSTVVQNRRLIA